ncbi:MAG: hypothetical protein MZU91_08390 [Desulfosudis oleivorans]|nr:hypothetical protein [Desulfosudis oleivorans]
MRVMGRRRRVDAAPPRTPGGEGRRTGRGRQRRGSRLAAAFWRSGGVAAGRTLSAPAFPFLDRAGAPGGPARIRSLQAEPTLEVCSRCWRASRTSLPRPGAWSALVHDGLCDPGRERTAH